MLVVYNLSVEITKGALYQPAIEATRQVALRAAQQRQNKDANAVNSLGGPKL
jgi:hypothetical protein